MEETTGDLEAMALYAGQSVGLIQQVLPAAEIVQKIIDDAERAVNQLISFSLGENNETTSQKEKSI